ncbi:MAG: glycogen/starch/alpha-glucan phosphorylase [Lachnospiraceae bacterium]|nr:glycogen/starch/alpha-glucan phosphorylase [Lachnospiraceae bacterium]MBQ1398916.1 glycogen/starch/alpha-glucan phosphorylase [Lachnospiraceae bacterium]
MAQNSFDKEQFKKMVIDNVKNLYRRDIEDAEERQIFTATSLALKDLIIDRWIATHKAINAQDAKTVYYLSMEFLMGRALGNNVINMQADVLGALEELGYDLNRIEDQERDWALGNGGLGRLAACFLDSLATLNYPAYGCGIRYHYGMFKQEIRDGYQVEVPDNWLKHGNPFEVRRDEYTCEIRFGGHVVYDYNQGEGRYYFRQEGYYAVNAVPYDIPVVGYGTDMVNTLRIWDAEPVSTFNLESFEKGDYLRAVEQEELARSISHVLYPNDNHYSGKELRLKQQYFFVSASIQTAVRKYMSAHRDIYRLHEKVIFQMNDTHPTIAVPELMRILMDDYHLTWEAAWNITTKCCAYTNHTIMTEALEKWPVDLFELLLPRIYQIVQEIDRRVRVQISEHWPGDGDRLERMAVISGGQIHMARMAVIASCSVNGVAALHTRILETKLFRDYYEIWPEKFSNKTNGITQRRFLLHANPLLAEWITARIGDGWVTDLPQLERLGEWLDDAEALGEFREIKYQNKVRVAEYIREHNGIDVDPSSIFDIQVKRLHEYKRQLMNILRVMILYNRLKDDPNLDIVPRTVIIGGKAAAGYERAKLIIKLVNSVADVVNNDPDIRGKLKVVFIEDYCVSNGELLFAAAEVSEQISTASKEASGTGNMKFLLNGALTIGTMDGANIEIVEEVGEENAFIFGMSSEEVIAHEAAGDYDPNTVIENDGEIRRAVMQLVNGAFSPNEPDLFRPLYDSLLYRTTDRADVYFTLKDLRSYMDAQDRVDRAYRDQRAWTKASLINVAHSGKFSSDRTIRQYVDEIWHLEKVRVNADS